MTNQTFGIIKCIKNAGRDGSVGIAIRYCLDCLWIESRWGRVFPHWSRLAPGHICPPVQWVLCLYPGGGSAPGRGFEQPPHLATRMKK